MASCLNQGSDRWFVPEQGQGFKASAAHTYQNVPSVPYPRRSGASVWKVNSIWVLTVFNPP